MCVQEFLCEKPPTTSSFMTSWKLSYIHWSIYSKKLSLQRVCLASCCLSTTAGVFFFISSTCEDQVHKFLAVTFPSTFRGHVRYYFRKDP